MDGPSDPADINLVLYLPTTPFFPLETSNVTSQSFISTSFFTESPPKHSYYQQHQFPLYCIQVTVALIGILTNIINIFTFLKIGLSDCVTISFFNLSITDLLHLVCFEVIRMLTILRYEHGISSSIVRLQDLGGWFGWMSVYFVDVSMYITVFATFQKCCCVVFPLKFKNVFTKRRSWIIISFIFLITLGLFLPVFINIFDKWFFDNNTKNSSLDWIKLNSGVEATVWRMLHRISLTLISQIIVILSLAIITVKLKKAVKFRMSTKRGDTSCHGKGSEELRMSSYKETRVIRSVQFIALIFVLSTMPTSINSMASVIFPDLNRLPRYRTIVLTIQAFMYFGGTINASVNMFVYLAYNTKYRTTLMRYFRKQEKNTRRKLSLWSTSREDCSNPGATRIAVTQTDQEQSDSLKAAQPGG